ncbi:MAG: MotA/TolQ/ExbB proton channel family protein [Parvibaculaceae bacterium]
MQGGEISPVELFLQAGPVVKAVIVMLVAASLWCWIIIFDALWTLSRLRRAIKSEGAHKSRMGKLTAQIFVAGREEAFAAQASPAEADRRSAIIAAMRRQAQELVESCQRGLPNLAVIASVAPFVGLFGTVWGIMTSFAGIAAAKDTSLAVVAPGIAEALAATAIGLAAAIPAAFAYNRLAAAFGMTSRGLNRVIEDYGTRLARENTPVSPLRKKIA